MRTTPHRYYVTPRITVDTYRGEAASPDDAAALVQCGCHVTLRDEHTARETLSILGMHEDEIDSAIRFGQTGLT